ncbi:hypothetical protein OtV6_154c [Ostreococcus tauri virus RT-2011]|nr:hypothetical protein OtV6_154c [Ostreococcus tauri virus RT-2011]
MSKGVIIGGVVVVMVCCSASSAAMAMMGGDGDSTTTPTGPAPVENDQAWRDNNPGAVIATVSPSCATPKTFNPNVKYEGPSGDNYYNYCHEMVLSQTPACKVELCKIENVYGACKDECNKE